MSGRPTCCCPVCELERALLTEINAASNETRYKRFASQSTVLSTFPTCNDLLAHLRQSHSASDYTSEFDDILGELLRVSRHPKCEMGEHLMLLILMPAIHKTNSQIVFRFPSLARDDIAQHLLTSVLDVLHSQNVSAQSSHFAFTICRAMRRRAFRWAVREADRTFPANTEGVALNEVPSDPTSSFEPQVLLGEFLSRCLSSGLLTHSEHELLVQFKIQGVSSEVLAARQNVSDVVFRHRMQRIVEKLRRAAKGPSAARRSPDTAVA